MLFKLQFCFQVENLLTQAGEQSLIVPVTVGRRDEPHRGHRVGKWPVELNGIEGEAYLEESVVHWLPLGGCVHRKQCVKRLIYNYTAPISSDLSRLPLGFWGFGV